MIRTIRFHFAALAMAILATVTTHIVDPVVHALERLGDFVVRSVVNLFSGGPLLFDTGAARSARWYGGDPLELSLQRDLEHDRSHSKRSAARHC